MRLLDGIDRDRVFAALRAEGIGANVHYAPVYLHSHYAKLGYEPGLCPVAEAASRQILTLPMFPAMTRSRCPTRGGRAHQSDGVSTRSSSSAKEAQSRSGRGALRGSDDLVQFCRLVTPTRPKAISGRDRTKPSAAASGVVSAVLQARYGYAPDAARHGAIFPAAHP